MDKNEIFSEEDTKSLSYRVWRSYFQLPEECYPDFCKLGEILDKGCVCSSRTLLKEGCTCGFIERGKNG